MPNLRSATGLPCPLFLVTATLNSRPYPLASSQPFVAQTKLEVLRKMHKARASLSHLQAICFAIAGFTLWVLADSAIKLAGQSSLPNYEVVAFLGIFIALFMAVFALCQRPLTQLWPKRPLRQLVRAFLDLGNNLFVVVALRHLPLTLFYILVFTAPMVIVVLARIFLHEHLGWRKAAAIITGFLGVVIAVAPFSSSGTGDWTGYTACAVCVSCFATAMVWSRVISQTERPESMTFFSGLVMAAAGLAAMLAYAAPLNLRLLAILAVMGFLCALGNICFFVALKHTTAANVSQYHYTQLVSGAVVAYLIFHEKPTRFMLIGAVLIVASGLYIAFHADIAIAEKHTT
jgi:drug/metabolite transporter (DMT)-like permease